MKSLIVEDDFVSRLVLQEILQRYGSVHIAVNGKEALTAILAALKTGQPYDLVCLDIMMPVMDGQDALKGIRQAEDQLNIPPLNRVKIFMVTAVGDKESVTKAIQERCDGYLIKPINQERIAAELRRLRLIT